MTQDDIRGLMKAIAPVIRDFVDERIAPLRGELEAAKGFAPADEAEADLISQLEMAYDFINGSMFDGRLPDPRITTHSHTDDWAHTRAAIGVISFHRVVLQLADRKTLQMLLAHEMCHLEAADADGGAVHGPRWQASMRRLGLSPDAHVLKAIPGGQFDAWLTAR